MTPKVTNKLWIISDTHFGHKNIVKYQQRPESHDIIMLSEWARLVGEDDQILHLGDVCMGAQGNRNRWYDLIGRMPGKKFLILGNHDRANDEYSRAGFTVVPEFVYRRIAFSHRPLTEARYDDDGNDWWVNIHGHTHANPYIPEDGSTLLEDRAYVNLCVENTEFKPRQLGTIYPVPKAAK